ncbi:casein kinase I [Drosophila tropicalis]|uniref:casein kinase I n=1 Tax=Drosophila tropicalis TaxID=46794 RepID=UPI0035ABD25F
MGEVANDKDTNFALSDFRIVTKLGAGSFGDIFMAENKVTSQRVAMKLEIKNCPHPQLHSEYKLYRSLSSARGIPRIYQFGSLSRYNVMVMELLGASLEELFNVCSRRFSLKTVLMLSTQMIERVEHLHNAKYVHRDIKPDNFLMGKGGQSHVVHIIDFGLTKKYFDEKTNTHISYKSGGRLTGTARYASINAMRGGEQSRRDDMEALGYVFMYFLRGNLPWQGLVATTKKQKYEALTEKKSSTTLEELCKGYPEEFALYLGYCRSLGFEETPQYAHVRRTLYNLYKRLQYAHDNIYDWITIKQLHNEISAAKEQPKENDTDSKNI